MQGKALLTASKTHHRRHRISHKRNLAQNIKNMVRRNSLKLTSLEKEFSKACSKHPHLKLLESQWRFDKELISKALQNVGSIFPHYSRHDASHSKQIIVNIERLLGEKIKHLTATDMWLILEAAYSHDIGMVITQRQIEDLDSESFKSFTKELSTQSEHPLCSFAKDWLSGSANLPIGSSSHEFIGKYTQLIAEWYRKKHPENSAKIIQNPATEIGLNSPRNELLPQRLFSCLASICNAHGKSFEETLLLPFSEAGMATEDCHPRYIAFLLRMGDLLDIDDNRFCPVMMRMAGPKLPIESQSHYDKHKSIRHFRLDSDRIEIEANCPTPESYEQAHQWFKWLEEEHYKQSQHWNIIAPSKKLGRLPTLSSPQVSIELPYITIEKGKKPRFKIDEIAILQLLRSTGLYTSKEESIREILQNAVDSTLIRIWIENKDKINKLNPTSKELHTLYNKHRIKAELSQQEDSDSFWLSIIDEGTGISEEDLNYMLNIGSSQNNKRRTALKDDMPLWYRPAGNFGIGLQSIYLLSDTFTIITKSLETNKALEITFSTKEKGVIIKNLEPNSVPYGARISIKIDISAFPDSITFDNPYITNALENYDLTKPDSDLRGYTIGRILYAIHKFNNGSPIKLISDGDHLSDHGDSSYFSNEANITLSNVTFNYTQPQIITLFRGQPFDGLNPQLNFVSCTADYCGHLALDFLTYNREKILPHARNKATQELKTALTNYIESEMHKIEATQQPFAAAFHFLHGDGEKPKYHDHLGKLPVILYGDKLIQLAEIIRKIKSEEINLIEVYNDHPIYAHQNQTPPPANEKTLILKNGYTTSLIKLLATQEGMYWQERLGYNNSQFNHSRCFAWSNEDIQPVDNDVFREILLGKTNSFDIGNRILFPAWGKYRKLAVNTNIPWPRFYWHTGSNTQYLVLPCKFKSNDHAEIALEEPLLDWTYSNLLDKTHTSREEHENLYNELTELLKNIQELN